MLIGSYRKPKGCRKLKREVTTFVERWGKKKEIPQNSYFYKIFIAFLSLVAYNPHSVSVVTYSSVITLQKVNLFSLGSCKGVKIVHISYMLI